MMLDRLKRRILRRSNHPVLSEVSDRCPECGADASHTQGSRFVGVCGHSWDKFPAEQLGQDLGGIPEPYSPSGHRCPMCKCHRLIEMDENLICPECGWAGQTFKQSKMTLPQQIKRWHDIWESHGMDESHMQPPETHRFDDGWHIYEHEEPHTINAVGQMMHNCWQNEENVEANLNSQLNDGWKYHSLHDEHGLPRAAFYTHDDPWNNLAPQLRSVLGPRNQAVDDDVYWKVKEWADANDIQEHPQAFDGPPAELRAQVGEPRQAMAADPEWLDHWIGQNGPYVYHRSIADPNSILTHGLLPWDHPENSSGKSNYHDALTPRSDHVYMQTGSGRATDGWSPHAQGMYRVDLRKLDPENLNPDEDRLLSDQALETYGLEDPNHELAPSSLWEGDSGYSRGQWAEENFLNDPSMTAWSLDGPDPGYGGTIAHRGPIPPEAIDYPYRQRTAAQNRSWHLTDNPHFELDPEYEPQDNAISVTPRSGIKGLYVGNPEQWFNGYDYTRPFAAEIEHPPASRGRWGGEHFIPPEDFAHSRVRRVIPAEDAINESVYGVPYEGPDVREMSSEQHEQMAQAMKDRIWDERPHTRTVECPDCGWAGQRGECWQRPQANCPCCDRGTVAEKRESGTAKTAAQEPWEIISPEERWLVELPQPDPNCKWCHGHGWFADPRGGPEIPCGKCMAGRIPSTMDARERAYEDEFSKKERRDMGKIPSEDLRTEGWKKRADEDRMRDSHRDGRESARPSPQPSPPSRTQPPHLSEFPGSPFTQPAPSPGYDTDTWQSPHTEPGECPLCGSLVNGACRCDQDTRVKAINGERVKHPANNSESISSWLMDVSGEDSPGEKALRPLRNSFDKYRIGHGTQPPNSENFLHRGPRGIRTGGGFLDGSPFDGTEWRGFPVESSEKPSLEPPSEPFPNGDHQLWFEPRSDDYWGRGLYHIPSGQITTWPEVEAEHRQMAESLGYSYGGSAPTAVGFDIRPDGSIGRVDWPNNDEAEVVRNAARKASPRYSNRGPRIVAAGEDAFSVWLRNSPEEEHEPFGDYLAMHNEADRDSGELMDVPEEQVERWYENWVSEGMPKVAMAERSGFPELDHAIEEFMHEYEGIQDFRDPQNAWGRCDEMANECAEFLKHKGFNAYATHDDLTAFPGYENAQKTEEIGAGEFTYPEHAMVEVYDLIPGNVNNVTIDFTASQYGFTEFPKVHGPNDSKFASSRTAKMKYFHTTNAEFAPGDIILPASQRGHKSPWTKLPQYNPDKVYLWDAQNGSPVLYQQHGANDYEVEPLGPVEPDDEQAVPGSWQTTHARVIRKLPSGSLEKDRYASEWKAPDWDPVVGPKEQGPIFQQAEERFWRNGDLRDAQGWLHQQLLQQGVPQEDAHSQTRDWRMRFGSERTGTWREDEDVDDEPLNCEHCGGEGFLPNDEACPHCEGNGFKPWLYHVAPTSERTRIQTHGLFPGVPSQSGQWPAVGEKFNAQPEGVYLDEDPYEVYHAMGHLHPKGLDVWRVNPNHIDPQSDPLWGGSVYHPGAISPESISLARGAEGSAWTDKDLTRVGHEEDPECIKCGIPMEWQPDGIRPDGQSGAWSCPNGDCGMMYAGEPPQGSQSPQDGAQCGYCGGQTKTVQPDKTNSFKYDVCQSCGLSGEAHQKECPQCQSPMYWRDSAGLTGLHPNGAWECSNQRCWHMMGPEEMAHHEMPEPSDFQHPDPWMDNEPGSLTLPEHWGKISGLTRNQRLRAIQEHEGEFGPDTAKVVHEFPDGWSVRQHVNPLDLHYEGHLMGNCFQLEPGDLAALKRDNLEDPPQPSGSSFSLRDPDNYPRVSFYQEDLGWHNRDGEKVPALTDTWGHSNSSIKPEYAQRLMGYANANGIAYSPDDYVTGGPQALERDASVYPACKQCGGSGELRDGRKCFACGGEGVVPEGTYDPHTDWSLGE